MRFTHGVVFSSTQLLNKYFLKEQDTKNWIITDGTV